MWSSWLLKLKLQHNRLTIFWQVDKARDPEKIKLEAKTKNDVVCVSALTGEGLDEFCNEIQNRLKVYDLFYFLKKKRAYTLLPS